ncbi:alpha/beta fold hydrolase [Microbacterium sp. F51-2R]|uniref:alpha/beta fold hydrolase n=1 Tax=Microbacterium sp. F51-2R TaxID=3445777 RepID=UPI003F9FEF1F
MTLPAVAFTDPCGPDGAPWLVLGPSLGTSSLLWQRVIPQLALEHRVVAWDLPGHGASPAAEGPFSVQDLASAVANEARLRGATSIRYAGVSLGGAVGLQLAIDQPSFVDALVVVASGAALGTRGAWLERAEFVRANTTAAMRSGSIQRWFAPHTLERGDDLPQRLLASLDATDDESYSRCCEALADYDVRADLGRVTPPVLVMWGEHDVVAPRAVAEQVHAGARGSRIVRIADAAHLPPAEAPGPVARCIAGFLEETTRNPAG